MKKYWGKQSGEKGYVQEACLGVWALMDLVGVFLLCYVAPRIVHDDSGIYTPDISYRASSSP